MKLRFPDAALYTAFGDGRLLSAICICLRTRRLSRPRSECKVFWSSKPRERSGFRENGAFEKFLVNRLGLFSIHLHVNAGSSTSEARASHATRATLPYVYYIALEKFHYRWHYHSMNPIYVCVPHPVP